MLTNKCEFEGNIYEISPISVTQSGKKVCKLTVSCRGPKLADGKALYEYVRCLAYDQRAELLTTYFKKGKAIHLLTHYHNYKGTDGNYYHDFIVDEIAFVPSDYVEQTAPQQPTQPQPQQMSQYAQQTLNVSPDDLPF